MYRVASIPPILPVSGAEHSDGSTMRASDNFAPAAGEERPWPQSDDLRGGGRFDAGGVGGGAGSVDEHVLRQLLHGLTPAQRHQVYLRARTWAARRSAAETDSAGSGVEAERDSEKSFIDFLALNVALRSMQGERYPSVRDQSSVDVLRAKRDALWEVSRDNILEWAPGWAATGAGERDESPSVFGNERGLPVLAGSTSALDFLRRLVLPRQGKVSGEWLRRALLDVSQAGKRIARGTDLLQQLTALKLSGFAVTVRQTNDVAGRLDRAWQSAGLSRRNSQLQLVEKLLEYAGTPGNFKAFCQAVAPDHANRPGMQHAIMTTIHRAVLTLPPQAWSEDGSRLKFQEGTNVQMREAQPKAWFAYRSPLVPGQATAPASHAHFADRGLLLWS